MNRAQTLKRIGAALAAVNVLLLVMAVGAVAQDEAEAAVGMTTGAGLAALGKGLALLGGALGTGLAMTRAIPAVVGAVAEDPGQLGTGILLIVIPETLVIFGFVALFLI